MPVRDEPDPALRAAPRPPPRAAPDPADDRGTGAAAPAEGARPWTDYSAEMRISRNPLLRAVYTGLGVLCLGLGILGAFVPGLPTTVWILVATFFFARSSPRFYNWVLNHPWFGRLVRDFRAGLGVPLWVKVLAIGMIALFAGSAALVFIPVLPVRILVGAIGAAGIVYLLRLPTRPLDPQHDGRSLLRTLLQTALVLAAGALGAALLRGQPTLAWLVAGTALVTAVSTLLVPVRRAPPG